MSVDVVRLHFVLFRHHNTKNNLHQTKVITINKTTNTNKQTNKHSMS